MTREEILDILTSSRTKTEACIKLGIPVLHRNGTKINQDFKCVCDMVGYDISLINISNRIKEDEVQYLNNPKTCPVCGKVISYKRRKAKTCSRSCGSTLGNKGRTHTYETKQKISNSSYIRNLSCGCKIHKQPRYKSTFLSSLVNAALLDNISFENKYTEKPIRICEECKQIYVVTDITKKGSLKKQKYCSDKCRHIASSRHSSENRKQEIANGTFKGWNSRNITSYAEKFWIEVLNNNNIEYTREYHLDKKYFLDFYIVKNGVRIDLEIDGKQHKYKERSDHDKERDEYIKNKGIIVYRIPWNTINSERGRIMMKEKIDNFLSFYEKI